MTIEPILEAPLAVQIHLAAAIVAAVLGPVAIYRKRRDRIHRWVGRTWVGVMVIVAISGLIIPAAFMPILGMFGPIHIFSVWVLFSLFRGVRAIRRRDVKRHKAEMQTMYWMALGIAGLFTLLPGRRLNASLFGANEQVGVWVIAGALAVGAIVHGTRKSRRASRA